MNNIELKFFISHLKKAIWNLECAQKFEENEFIKKTIEELKIISIQKQIELEKGE